MHNCAYSIGTVPLVYHYTIMNAYRVLLYTLLCIHSGIMVDYSGAVPIIMLRPEYALLAYSSTV